MLSKQKEQLFKKHPEIDPHINDLDQNKLKEFMNYFRADSTKEPDKQLIDYISSKPFRTYPSCPKANRRVPKTFRVCPVCKNRIQSLFLHLPVLIGKGICPS